MAQPFIKTSFSGGEINPALAGRVDLAKYQVSAATMRNFFVDYRGGASTRPGTKHVGRPRQFAGQPKPRLIPFIFSSSQSYALELNNNTMRVITNGAYVLEANKPIAAVLSKNPLQIQITAHGWSIGDFIVCSVSPSGLARPNGISGVAGRTFYVSNVAGDVVTLSDYAAGATYAPVDGSTWTNWVSGGSFARIYQVTTPWSGADLFGLKYAQSADTLTVTSNNFPAYNIKRLGNTNWTVTRETYGSTTAAPVISSITKLNAPSSPGVQFFYAYVVTTVDSAGRESVPSAVGSITFDAQDQTKGIGLKIAYGAVSGAYKYLIYKAQPVPNGSQSGGPYFYGLIGTSFTDSFIDMNFAPDYNQGPPQARNPFLDSGIASVSILTAGSGYLQPVANITDASGTGASVSLGSDTSLTAPTYGAINVANVVAAGTGYVAPVVNITDAAPLGSGLTLAFDGTWVPAGGNFSPAPGSITIANGGSNYHKNSYAGFITGVAHSTPVVGQLLVVNITQVVNGVVTGISWSVTGPGSGLSSVGSPTTIDFTTVGTDTPASGATATLNLGGSSNPACVAYVDQRKVFAGTPANPSTFYMSRTGQYTNFNVSEPPQDDDAVTGTLVAQEVNIIQSMAQVPSGLIAFTAGGCFLISGGSSGGAVTPSTVSARQQAFGGASALAPLQVGDHLLYCQSRGSSVRDLAYNFYTNNFTGDDVSYLASHLLEGRTITQWAWAEEPLKMIWAVRDDGVLLSLTYMKSQEVYGWARHDTAGPVVSVCSIPEGTENAVYIVVQRYTPDLGFVYHTERMASRLYGANPAANIPADPEQAWCVDGGAQYPLTTPAVAILSGVQQGNSALYDATIVDGGTGYANSPAFELTDPYGSGAVITVGASGGVINAVNVVSGGSKYYYPTLKIAGGSGAVVSFRIATTILFTFGAAAFSAADIGKVMRVPGGRGVVLACPAGNQLLVKMIMLPQPTPNVPGGLIFSPVAAGLWSLTAPVTTIGGLDHLNGSIVQVLADGGVQAPKTVSDGCITLDNSASAIIVGQGFTCQLETLALEYSNNPTSQGQRKQIPTLTVRAKDTRGIRMGQVWNALVEQKERTTEPMGSPISFMRGGTEEVDPSYANAPGARAPYLYPDRLTILQAPWEERGAVCVYQDYPLPATILAIIPTVLMGDTAQ